MLATESNNKVEYNPNVRWVIPQNVDCVAFVGRDILAVASDIYIIFFNFKTLTETVYVANNTQNGDGVDVIAGHKTNLFAFAEKAKHPRIFMVQYNIHSSPTFQILAEMRDMEVNRYKGLCMMECDLVATFSGFPNYTVSVWSWRTQQRLIAVRTGVERRKQIYMASRSHLLVCECWGEGLIVWEVAQCYKRSFMMRRAKEEVVGWEVAEPALVAVCWSNEGQLYAIDANANLYSVLSDGIGMVTNLEWSEDLKGPHKAGMCAFGNGILICGPDKYLRSLKKSEKSWKVVWQYEFREEILRLVSNAMAEGAAVWTRSGCLYRISGEAEDRIDLKLITFKHRDVKKIQLIAPRFTHVAMINGAGVLCVYDVVSGKLATMTYFNGDDISFEASPMEPLLVVYGEVGSNYGIVLVKFDPDRGLEKVGSACLTHQIISRVVFSSTGREILAAAMFAGHVFVYQLSEKYELTLKRYKELGCKLADCTFMKICDVLYCIGLVLSSNEYAIGERIKYLDLETGDHGDVPGKTQGPYGRLLPLTIKDTLLAIPHLSKQFHLLKLSYDGDTVFVKLGSVFRSGHDMRQFNGVVTSGALLTCGYAGAVILRTADAPEQYELKLAVTHRYQSGIQQAVIDSGNTYIAHLAGNKNVAVTWLRDARHELGDLVHDPPDHRLMDSTRNTMDIIGANDKNYLDLLEEIKVSEEAEEWKVQRDAVVRDFKAVQARLVALLDDNLVEPPLHQLSLSEFDLHLENRKERLKKAEREREVIRSQTEARILAQDEVTAWIKATCWDTMLTPRVKLYAIFSHYQVENYAVLPTQRDKWPELQQVEALRSIEMENDADLFRPWEEREEVGEPLECSREQFLAMSLMSIRSARMKTSSSESQAVLGLLAADVEEQDSSPHVLSGSDVHKFVSVPAYMVSQTLAYSFLHMNYLHHIVKLNVQNMRLWFNKQFDELMNLKKREVGLVEERNARLRFIVQELNKLSDLRGSFHHLAVEIRDPEWRQEEQPQKLIVVEPEECTIEPYVSPSQVVVPPPEPKPKDDFRERALLHMMDGVLEKLWHEEIKKPIPVPQCMLEKNPEQFNEEDLRVVFEYEAKVASRNEERDKYRKMLHAEYGKLAHVLDEGVANFNQKVKEMWLTKLQVDSIIGQERLNLMRLRRTNIDRVEMDEKLESMRCRIARLEQEVEELSREQALISSQAEECQSQYEVLAQRDKYLEKTFKNPFADLSPIIVDQCYKFYRKRPKWHQRATMTPIILYELASTILTGQKAPMLHYDCLDYVKGMEQLDLISNMPPVMDEGLWATMCKLRRTKIENEIRMRAVVQDLAYVESANNGWSAAIQARKHMLALIHDQIIQHRHEVEMLARNKTIQLVLPAGQVELLTTGHVEDFEDATLILRKDIDHINNLILKVGDMKLRMMRKQMEFRKGILSKEWEHAQTKMKLRHLEQELRSYERLKIPKELQLYLKKKEQGETDEQDHVRMEKEMEASKLSVNKVLADQIHRSEELEVKLAHVEAQCSELEKLIATLRVKVSEKRLAEDPLDPIRIRRVYKRRMETVMLRGQLVREVQANHVTIVMLQTELELLRLKTYPTLATFRTIC